MRVFARCLLVALAICTLAACAKKSDPVPPAGVPSTYPRIYPHE